MYRWTDYIQNKTNADILGTMDFILGTSNGVTIIRWNKNYQIKDGSYDGKFSTEMCTGWGTYTRKHLKNDYGWENGIILNMSNNKNAPFIHIWYRTKKKLYMWEIRIGLADVKLATNMKLLEELKKHINYHFYIIDKTKTKSQKKLNISEDFVHFIDEIYFIIAPINKSADSPDPKYWITNNNFYKHKNKKTNKMKTNK